jgi:hypothetical protein
VTRARLPSNRGVVIVVSFLCFRWLGAQANWFRSQPVMIAMTSGTRHRAMSAVLQQMDFGVVSALEDEGGLSSSS